MPHINEGGVPVRAHRMMSATILRCWSIVLDKGTVGASSGQAYDLV